MKKFIVTIEETCVQNFEIWADNHEEALNIAENKYKNGEIVLSPGDCQFRQMAITEPLNNHTEWKEF